MIEVTVVEKNNYYYPLIKFVGNESIDISKLATILHYLNNGTYVEIIRKKLEKVLDPESMEGINEIFTKLCIADKLSQELSKEQLFVEQCKTPIISKELTIEQQMGNDGFMDNNDEDGAIF